MKEQCHCLHKENAVDFANVHIKDNDRREGKSPFTFEALHETVEESLTGHHRKKSFENDRKYRKRAGEQKKKLQNGRI